MKTKTPLLAALTSVLAASSAHAAISTLAGFTRTAGGAATTVTNDFVDTTDEGWTGSPLNSTNLPNTLNPIYLTTTVSWAATTGNIGTFNVRFNQNDNAGAARLGMGKTGGLNAGFEFITANVTSDVDGPNPGTARPTITSVNANQVTSITLVMKIDHSLGGTPPSTFGGLYTNTDRWYATEGQQADALGFMWINPDLGAPEAGQFTPWAAWRSGNGGYSGVSFISDTDAVDLVFSNIAVYTEGDTPFSAIPEPSSTVLIGLAGLGLLTRRRR